MFRIRFKSLTFVLPMALVMSFSLHGHEVGMSVLDHTMSTDSAIVDTENIADVLDASSLEVIGTERPKLIIILDDLGNNKHQAEQSAELPVGVTFAVLPHTPYAKTVAQTAKQQGREVMLHMPMANHSGSALGEGGITVEMQKTEVLANLNDALDSVPHVVGVNNHMGSALTEQKAIMEWLIADLKSRDLYFVDSLTSSQSVGWKAAQEAAVPFLKRHVFLDHLVTEEFIAKQFTRALAIANERGYAVVIGHPYPETLAYLAKALPTLTNIDLVAASYLVDLEKRQALVERFRTNASVSAVYH